MIGANRISSRRDLFNYFEGIYLDDFQDEKLSSRDSYIETSLTPNELGGKESFSKDGERAEWTVNNSSPSFTNGVLEVNTGDRIYTPIPTNDILNNDTTWEFKVENTGNVDSSSSNSHVGLIVNNSFTGNWDNPSEGYWVQINDSTGDTNQGFALTRNNDTDVINGTADVDTLKYWYFKVTRSSSGVWEMFYTTTLPFESSDSIGTYTETSEPNFNYHTLSARNDFSAGMKVDYTLIY